MIIANTLFVGIDVDMDHKNGDFDTGSIFFILNVVFAIFFSIEILIRIVAYKSISGYFTDPTSRVWNIIDVMFVVVIDLESFVFPSVIPRESTHYVRVFRLIRLVRIFRVYVDIRILAATMRSIIASVGYVCHLLVSQILVMYVLSLLLVNWSRTTPQLADVGAEGEPHFYFEHFGHVYSAGLSLFQLFTADGCFVLMNDVLHTTAYMGVILLFYFAFSTMLIYNILIGGVCRAVSANAVIEQDNKIDRIMQRAMKRGDPLLTGVVSVPTFEIKVGPKLMKSDVFNGTRIEVAKAISLRQSEDGSAIVNTAVFVQTYLKLSKPVQAQDLVTCLHEIDTFYQLIHDSIH
jgi:hypothetical protein